MKLMLRPAASRFTAGHCWRCLSVLRLPHRAAHQEADKGVVEKRRKRLVILGSGWGSYAVLRSIDKKQYDVIVVSPRNHFLFTPLLCSTTVGTLEFRYIDT